MQNCQDEGNRAPSPQQASRLAHLLLLLCMLLTPWGTAQADHIRGQFVAEQGHVLRVSQRGLSVQRTLLVANGQQLSLV